MPAHETKNCPRCGQPFECKVGNISLCQCNGTKLTLEEQSFIESKYEDCLCGNCLKEMKNKYTVFKEKFLLHGR